MPSNNMRCPDCSAMCELCRLGYHYHWYCPDCEWESDMVEADKNDEVPPQYTSLRDATKEFEPMFRIHTEKGKVAP